MDIFFYIIIFLLGACIGSFYATFIQRVLKQKRIFSIHSYCQKCGEKLKISEKIPIFSYLFLKGKCNNCKKKIESKYIILELITGIIFVITAYALNLSEINIINIISFIFIILYFTYIILVAGIDLKEKRMSSVILAYGILISIIYMIYMLFNKGITLYTSTTYLTIVVLLLLLNVVNTKKHAQNSYVIDILTMLMVMLIFTGEIVCILTIAGTLMSVVLYILINKIKQSKSKIKKGKKIYSSNIKIIYIMAVLNMFIFLLLISINKYLK